MYVFASIAAIILVVIAALLFVGFVYQWIGSRNDLLRYANPGRWVDIGNHCRLYLLEKGEGGPAVLFESGISATNLNWRHIQKSVSQFTHTVSYDRGGLGWSSAASSARTPGNIAIELHSMLEFAGIKSPYILVGHSFGGLIMRRFALLYPEEVLGLVLVDPMRVEEWPPLDPSKQATLDRGKKFAGFAIPIARFGLARLAVRSLLCGSGHLSGFFAAVAGTAGKQVLGRIKGEVIKMPQEVWPVVAAHWSRPSYYAGMYGHVESVPDSVREMNASGPIHGIPVVLLTPGNSPPLCEKRLNLIGDNVHQLIAAESAHWIHLDDPALVIDSIREMVLAAIAIAETEATEAPTAMVGGAPG